MTDYESIAREHRQGYGSYDRHLRIYRRLYDDETHFVYELIQNADDSRSESLSFILRDAELLVINDGRRFNEGEKNDVRDICSIGLSEKDLTQIGSFGIGFKAVYAYSDAPQVYSGNERFEIKRLVEPAGIGPRPDVQEKIERGQTVFCLPFKKDLRSEKVSHLASRLAELHAWTLLFLRHLSAIHWQDERTGKRGTYQCSRSPHEKLRDGVVVLLTKLAEGSEPVKEQFIVFRKLDATLIPPTEIIEELMSQAEDEYERDRITRSARQEQSVEVAFRYEKDRFTPAEGSVLFSYLPAQKPTHLRFLIQARYQTTPARNDVPRHNKWNDWLMAATADFLPEVLRSLKDAGLLQPEFFDALPQDGDDVADFVEPITTALSRALAQGEFILTDYGGYARPQEVFSPQNQEMRNLLAAAQLPELTGVPNAKWLHRNMRQGRRFKVVQTAGVKELSLQGFADSISKKFLEAQSDEWLAKFYAFLKGQEHLWRRGQHGQTDGVLRGKPIIRLESGSYVCAFRGDAPCAYLPPEGETAFPVVRRLLISDPDALEFLKRLGLTVPAIEDEVADFILPKYDKDDTKSPSEAEHAADWMKIVHALQLDSQKARERVKSALKEAQFFRAVNSASGQSSYKRGRDIYFPTAELKRYFNGNKEAWFLDESPLDVSPDNFRPLMKEVGIEDRPRIVEFDPKLSRAQMRQIIGEDEHITRGTTPKAKDYNLDGLDWFLDRLFQLPAGQTIDSAKILWDFLVSYCRTQYSWTEVRGFQGKCTYQSYGERHAYFLASFLKQLRTQAWLPDKNGVLHQPEGKMSQGDLPETFQANGELAKALRMIPPAATALARELGIDPVDVEYLRDPVKLAQFKSWAAQQDRETETPTGETEGKKPQGEDRNAVSSGGHRADSGNAGISGTGGGHSSGGMGGEGTLHERLKDKIAENPELLEPGLKLHRRECGLESRYRPDLILQDAEGKYVTVEVEAAFPGGNDTGMWQAVAYKHVFAVELGVPCVQVRGFLVAPAIPDSIKTSCRQYGVEPFEIGDAR